MLGLDLGEDFALLLELGLSLLDALLAELDLEALVLDFLVEGFELAVVADAVLLLLEPLDHGTRVDDGLLALLDLLLDAVGLLSEALEARGQSGQFVLQILDFEGKLTADHAEAVDAAVDQLEVIQRPEFLLCARGFGLLGHQDT